MEDDREKQGQHPYAGGLKEEGEPSNNHNNSNHNNNNNTDNHNTTNINEYHPPQRAVDPTAAEKASLHLCTSSPTTSVTGTTSARSGADEGDDSSHSGVEQAAATMSQTPPPPFAGTPPPPSSGLSSATKSAPKLPGKIRTSHARSASAAATIVYLQCPYCSKQYVGDATYSGVRSNYRRHLNAHTNTHPYACPFCPFDSVTLAAVRKHIHRHHADHPGAIPIKRQAELPSRTTTPTHAFSAATAMAAATSVLPVTHSPSERAGSTMEDTFAEIMAKTPNSPPTTTILPSSPAAEASLTAVDSRFVLLPVEAESSSTRSTRRSAMKLLELSEEFRKETMWGTSFRKVTPESLQRFSDPVNETISLFTWWHRRSLWLSSSSNPSSSPPSSFAHMPSSLSGTRPTTPQPGGGEDNSEHQEEVVVVHGDNTNTNAAMDTDGSLVSCSSPSNMEGEPHCSKTAGKREGQREEREDKEYRFRGQRFFPIPSHGHFASAPPVFFRVLELHHERGPQWMPIQEANKNKNKNKNKGEDTTQEKRSESTEYHTRQANPSGDGNTESRDCETPSTTPQLIASGSSRTTSRNQHNQDHHHNNNCAICYQCLLCSRVCFSAEWLQRHYDEGRCVPYNHRLAVQCTRSFPPFVPRRRPRPRRGIQTSSDGTWWWRWPTAASAVMAEANTDTSEDKTTSPPVSLTGWGVPPSATASVSGATAEVAHSNTDSSARPTYSSSCLSAAPPSMTTTTAATTSTTVDQPNTNSTSAGPPSSAHEAQGRQTDYHLSPNNRGVLILQGGNRAALEAAVETERRRIAATAAATRFVCPRCELELSSKPHLKRHTIFYCPFRDDTFADRGATKRLIATAASSSSSVLRSPSSRHNNRDPTNHLSRRETGRSKSQKEEDKSRPQEEQPMEKGSSSTIVAFRQRRAARREERQARKDVLGLLRHLQQQQQQQKKEKKKKDKEKSYIKKKSDRGIGEAVADLENQNQNPEPQELEVHAGSDSTADVILASEAGEGLTASAVHHSQPEEKDEDDEDDDDDDDDDELDLDGEAEQEAVAALWSPPRRRAGHKRTRRMLLQRLVATKRRLEAEAASNAVVQDSREAAPAASRALAASSSRLTLPPPLTIQPASLLYASATALFKEQSARTWQRRQRHAADVARAVTPVTEKTQKAQQGNTQDVSDERVLSNTTTTTPSSSSRAVAHLGCSPVATVKEVVNQSRKRGREEPESETINRDNNNNDNDNNSNHHHHHHRWIEDSGDEAEAEDADEDTIPGLAPMEGRVKVLRLMPANDGDDDDDEEEDEDEDEDDDDTDNTEEEETHPIDALVQDWFRTGEKREEEEATNQKKKEGDNNKDADNGTPVIREEKDGSCDNDNDEEAAPPTHRSRLLPFRLICPIDNCTAHPFQSHFHLKEHMRKLHPEVIQKWSQDVARNSRRKKKK